MQSITVASLVDNHLLPSNHHPAWRQDSTRALPSEDKFKTSPNKPACQGGLRLQLVKFTTGKQPWCLKPKVQNCWLPLELQRCHCALKYSAANREVFSPVLGTGFQNSRAPVQDNAGTKGKYFLLLKDASIFFLTICTTNRSDWA